MKVTSLLAVATIIAVPTVAMAEDPYGDSSSSRGRGGVTIHNGTTHESDVIEPLRGGGTTTYEGGDRGGVYTQPTNRDGGIPTRRRTYY